jgi:hypothetical protein
MKEDLLKYAFNILISIIGFFMVYYFTKTNTTLASISSDLINVRIDLSEIRATMMTEDRVKEIIDTELLKHGIK